MSPPPTDRRRTRHDVPETEADDVLCYADQGSFLGLRALGRGPVLQFTWLMTGSVDEAMVASLNQALAQGLLARLVQRSPLPWGRHRWVRSLAAPPVTWLRDPVTANLPDEARARLLALTVDPERGPGWRLVVQALEGGGYALTLLVSHTLADGQGTVLTVADAVAGRSRELGYRAVSSRWSPAMLSRDGAESLRNLPTAWRALWALFRRPRQVSAQVPRHPTAPSARLSASPDVASRDALFSDAVVSVPLLQLTMAESSFDDRAAELRVSGNTLFAILSARLAVRMGRVSPDGLVKLVLPVSDRTADDRRGNALRSVTVMAEPEACLRDPRTLQRDLRAALGRLLRQGDDFAALFPLLPYVRPWLARRLESLALGADLPVGCSILGTLPPELKRPCGAASSLQLSLLERYTAADLERLGGLLFLICYRLDGRVCVTASGYAPGRITGRAAFLPVLQEALADLGLAAELI
jgi:diacylglycerol O-acyltransferase